MGLKAVDPVQAIDSSSAAPVVDALQEHIEQAECGKIQAVGIISLHTSGSVSTTFQTTAFGADQFKLLGGVDWLRHRIITEWVEYGEEEEE